MRLSIISHIICFGLILSDSGLEAATQFSKSQVYLLPWEMIVEKFCDNTSLWGRERVTNRNGSKSQTTNTARINYSSNYACQPDKSIIVCLPTTISNIGPLSKISVISAKYEKNSWRTIGEVSASLEQDVMKIVGGTGKEGFFKFSCAFKGHNGELHNFDAYAIVCRNWKKDILTFCRKLKEDIELNRDSQLIRSCITISHFDHCMEMVSEASFFSINILKALTDAVRSRDAFNKGQYPDLVIGLNILRLRRFEGIPIEEFAVLIPNGYSSSKAWPVLLHTRNSGWKGRDTKPTDPELIDMWWHSVSHKEIKWKEYTTIIKVIGEKLNIDRDRMYVEGDCYAGLTASALALHYPDYWAECNAALGNSYRYLAGNATNLPMIFVGTHHMREDSMLGFYEFTAKCYQYKSCRNFKHSWTQGINEIRGTSIPTAVREKSPKRVLFTIESLSNPSAYWIKIKGREDENLLGTIDVYTQRQTVFVKINNISAYVLDLAQAPLDVNQPVEIIENGESLGFTRDRIYAKESKSSHGVAYIKNNHLHGPVWDVFTDPYVVIWGSDGTNKEFADINEETARLLANGGLCFSTANMPQELTKSHNIVLIGMEESNLQLSRVSKHLPVRIEKDLISANDRSYSGDTGFILIYPNPNNPKKYLAVFSGTTLKAMKYIFKAYSEMRLVRPADVGIYEITNTGSIKWHVIEKFNTAWNWHKDWDQILFNIDSKKPRWKWHQWIAKTVRDQLQADVVFCEEPFIFKNQLPAGQVTYRDLFNTLKNVWFIKTEMNGKVLRSLLTVPLKDVSLRDVKMPVVEGVSLQKSPKNTSDSILTINDIDDDMLYTIVLPEKCLNGNRLGVVVTNYKIIGDYYLIPLLKDYFSKNNNINMNKQLDSIKLNLL